MLFAKKARGRRGAALNSQPSTLNLPVIRAQALAKHFGSLRAVDGIDLDVAQGEFFAFLGPNAAGKTTTIKMLCGLLRPSAGTVEIGGVDIQREPERA